MMKSKYTAEQFVNCYRAYEKNTNTAFVESQSGIKKNSVTTTIYAIRKYLKKDRLSPNTSLAMSDAIAILKGEMIDYGAPLNQTVSVNSETDSEIGEAYANFEDKIVSFILKRVESQIAEYKEKAAQVNKLNFIVASQNQEIKELKRKNADLQLIVEEAKKSNLGNRIISGLSKLNI